MSKSKAERDPAVIHGNDPVHEHEGKWWFYEETWADRQGPWNTKAEANAALVRYMDFLETGKPYDPHAPVSPKAHLVIASDAYENSSETIGVFLDAAAAEAHCDKLRADFLAQRPAQEAWDALANKWAKKFLTENGMTIGEASSWGQSKAKEELGARPEPRFPGHGWCFYTEEIDLLG